MARERGEPNQEAPSRYYEERNSGSMRQSPDAPPPPRGQPLREVLTSAMAQDKLSPQEIDLLADKLAEKLGYAQPTSPQQDTPNIAAPKPMHASASSLPRRNVYTPPSPERFEGSTVSDSQTSRVDGSRDQDTSPRSGLRPMSPPGTGENAESRSRSRPAGPVREPTDGATPLEKIWGHLFDKETQEPTPRLSQFLRGVALHIIEDYEPKGSLVVTPQKMQRFYTETKQNDEFYPWDIIFGGTVSPSNISHAYRDLRCEHHFVQTGNDARPCIPALTPSGFAHWMEYAILSHPDLEHRRFSYAVLNMPINNADDRSFRFPKELPRKLFPAQEDRVFHMDFEDALLADRQVELLRRSTLDQGPSHDEQDAVGSPPPASMPPPPPPPASQSNPGPSRARKVRSETSSDVDLEEGAPSSRIERNRMPYYAREGGGKQYDTEAPTSPRGEQLHPRANTTASGTRPVDMPMPDEFRSRSGRPRQNSQAAPPPAGWARAGSPPSSSAPPAGSFYRVSTNESYTDPSYRRESDGVDDDGYLSRQYSRDPRRDERRSRYEARDYPPPRAPNEDDQYRRRDTIAGQGPGPYPQYPPPPQRY